MTRNAFGPQRPMSPDVKARNVAESITAHSLALTQETWTRYGLQENPEQQARVCALLDAQAITILAASPPKGLAHPDTHSSACDQCDAVDWTHFMRVAVQHGQVLATLCLACGAQVRETQRLRKGATV